MKQCQQLKISMCKMCTNGWIPIMSEIESQYDHEDKEGALFLKYVRGLMNVNNNAMLLQKFNIDTANDKDGLLSKRVTKRFATREDGLVLVEKWDEDKNDWVLLHAVSKAIRDKMHMYELMDDDISYDYSSGENPDGSSDEEEENEDDDEDEGEGEGEGEGEDDDNKIEVEKQEDASGKQEDGK